MNSINIADMMQNSGVTFGTSGARGLVANMTEAVCIAYTLAFIKVMQQNFNVQRLAVGIDLRPSSPNIAAACISGLAQAGIDADYCGALPTPALALYAQTQQIPAMMVTGSHIPFDRNGIKFYRPDGEISKTDELAIAATTVELNNIQLSALPNINQNALQEYRQRYLNFFPANTLQGLHLGVYEHSSVARDVLSDILQNLGARVSRIERTDTFVPIDTEAVSEEDQQRGQYWSKHYALDAIISTDGDGDRPLIADEQGHWLRGDIVGLLTSQYLGIQQLAVPISCNTAIELCGLFKQVTRTKIGSPYVIAAMQTMDNTLGPKAGCEANGGYLLGSNIIKEQRLLLPLPTRDAILPALAILASAQAAKQPISNLLTPLPKRYTASDRLQNFPVAQSKELFTLWQQDTRQITQWLSTECGQLQHLDSTDGLRFTFENQDIVHLRASGNAPELRCYCESNSEEEAQQLTSKVLSWLVLQIIPK